MKRILWFISMCTFTQPLSAAIDHIPIGATMRSFKETAIEEPYKETDQYIYSKGLIYNRWIHSPWLKLEATSAGQKLSFNKKQKKTGYISAEISSPTTKLALNQDYILKAELAYECPTTQEGSDRAGCINEYVVRCYGYVDGVWSKTFEESRRQKGQGARGTFQATNIKINRKKCSRSVRLSIKSHLNLEAKHFLFKDMKLAFIPKP